MVVKTTRLTAAAFERVAHRFGPCELVRGEVVFLSPGGLHHSSISARLTGILFTWCEQTGQGRIFTNETGLITARRPDTVRGADVVYYSFTRLPESDEPQGFCAVPPELVVEVLGKKQGWPEMLEKAAEYLTMGVDRVWIVDPKHRRVRVLRADVEPTVLGERQYLRDPVILPGFRVRVGEFFK